MADAKMEDDSDPITASYDIYMKPHISENRQMYILQFPNRRSRKQYSASKNAQPLALRVKSQNGMVELDVPVDPWQDYEREKGIKWGEAIRKSSDAKGGGSHGLPGGFGIGGAAPIGRARGRGRGREEGSETLSSEALLADYAGSIQRGQVWTKNTLGGQTVSNAEATPRYMIGSFRKNQLHLTPADHIVQMHPQFHHIDAESEQMRQAVRREAGVPQRLPEARAIHMTVKSNVDGEEDSLDTMALRIAAVQKEPWRSHTYTDEDTDEAWHIFNASLFVGQDLISEESSELQAKLPKLQTSSDNAEYMDTISAPSNAAKVSRSKNTMNSKGEKGKVRENDGDTVMIDDHSILPDDRRGVKRKAKENDGDEVMNDDSGVLPDVSEPGNDPEAAAIAP